MKTEKQLNSHVTATLYTDADVPRGRTSPLLVLSSTQYALEGLGGYGPPDEVEVCGEEALAMLASMLESLQK